MHYQPTSVVILSTGFEVEAVGYIGLSIIFPFVLHCDSTPSHEAAQFGREFGLTYKNYSLLKSAFDRINFAIMCMTF